MVATCRWSPRLKWWFGGRKQELEIFEVAGGEGLSGALRFRRGDQHCGRRRQQGRRIDRSIRPAKGNRPAAGGEESTAAGEQDPGQLGDVFVGGDDVDGDVAFDRWWIVELAKGLIVEMATDVELEAFVEPAAAEGRVFPEQAGG